MPRTKKAAPVEEAVVKTEEVAAAPAAASAAEVKKPAAKKTAAKKPAAKKAPAEKKAPAKAVRAPRKAATAVFVQYADKQATPEELADRAKADWTAKGNDLAAMKKIAVYFKADDGMVYYAVNDDENSGSFAL